MNITSAYIRKGRKIVALAVAALLLAGSMSTAFAEEAPAPLEGIVASQGESEVPSEESPAGSSEESREESDNTESPEAPEEFSALEEGSSLEGSEAETYETSPTLITGTHSTYMSGYAGGYFYPDKAMTRGEVAQMLYNLLAAKPAVSSSQFSDVDISAWYGKAVNALAQMDIIGGYSDGTFRPKKSISRAEFVTLLSRCFGILDGAVSYPDVSESNWAYKYIVSATLYGWTGGFEDGSFGPNKSLTRAQAVKIMNVALERTGDGFAEDRNDQKFVDVPSTHWAFLHVAEAAKPLEGSTPPTVNGKYVRTTATSGLNFRSGPGSSYPSLGVLPLGTVLTVVDTKSAPWICAKKDSGTTGYVHQDYVQNYTPGQATITISSSAETIHQYQTLYLVGSASPSGTALSWSSSNSNVATVSNGFVYGKAAGTAVITCASSGGSGSSSCTVTVTGPEGVRAAYTNPNLVSAGKAFQMVAVTDTGKSAVKFTVVGGGTGEWTTTEYTQDSSSADGLPTNTVRTFTKSVTFNTPGSYTVRATSKTGNSFSSDYREFEVLVVSSRNDTETSFDDRKVSTELLKILANYEGYLPTVYPDKLAGNIPTVGYGYVISENEAFYNNVTKSECMALLAEEVDSHYAPTVNTFRSRYSLKMNQCQFDALTSFIYNCGGGTLLEQSGGEPYYGTARVITNAVTAPSSYPVSGTVNISDGNVYESADASAKKTGTVKLGATVSVEARKVQSDGGVWYQVTSGSVKGWTRAGNIRLSGSYTHDLANVDAITFGNNLTQWNMADGVHLVGLFDRRMSEARLFSYGDYANCYHGSSGYDKNPGYDIPSWYY